MYKIDSTWALFFLYITEFDLLKICFSIFDFEGYHLRLCNLALLFWYQDDVLK